MEFTAIGKIKKEIDEKQFLRNVLIGLSKDPKSPSNILKAKFGKVCEYEAQILVLTADIQVSYSGSCGYDRQEQYQTTEQKYVRQGEEYICEGIRRVATYNGSQKVDVVKTRTVTDWSSHSGVINTTQVEHAFNDDNKDKRLLDLFPFAFMDQKSDNNIIEAVDVQMKASAYEYALDSCEKQACWEVKWPGDHHKDESYNCKMGKIEVACFIAPYYVVEFEYNGKKYRARGFAFGKVNEVHELPTSAGGVQSIDSIEKRRVANVAEAEKPYKVRKFFVFLSVIMAIVGLYGVINRNMPGTGASVCMPLGFISMAIGILIAIVINNKVKKAVAEINFRAENEKRNLKNEKVNNLVTMLKNLNLPALSSVEKNSI